MNEWTFLRYLTGRKWVYRFKYWKLPGYPTFPSGQLISVLPFAAQYVQLNMHKELSICLPSVQWPYPRPSAQVVSDFLRLQTPARTEWRSWAREPWGSTRWRRLSCSPVSSLIPPWWDGSNLALSWWRFVWFWFSIPLWVVGCELACCFLSVRCARNRGSRVLWNVSRRARGSTTLRRSILPTIGGKSFFHCGIQGRLRPYGSRRRQDQCMEFVLLDALMGPICHFF